jgi:hypothetical protein
MTTFNFQLSTFNHPGPNAEATTGLGFKSKIKNQKSHTLDHMKTMKTNFQFSIFNSQFGEATTGLAPKSKIKIQNSKIQHLTLLLLATFNLQLSTSPPRAP